MADLVCVEWVDSRSARGHWAFLEDVASDGVVGIQSVGWLCGETAECIHLVPHMSTDGAQVSGDLFIPKSAIWEVTRLKTKGKKSA